MLVRTLLLMLCAITTNAEFNCLKNPIPKREIAWSGGLKASATYLLKHDVTDWVIEIHFDRTIKKLLQWVANPKSKFILQQKKQIFLFEPRAYNRRLRAGRFLFEYVVYYDGYLEPKVSMIALCGDTTATDPTVPSLTTTPAPPPTLGPVRACQEVVGSSWYDGAVRTLILPKPATHWILELKFDSPWKRFQQWSCTVMKKTNGILVCDVSRNGHSKMVRFQYLIQFKTGKTPPQLLEAWFGNYHCKN